jgi:FtsP/CotA-like multicopper oxidase with cupredoxin domain
MTLDDTRAPDMATFPSEPAAEAASSRPTGRRSPTRRLVRRLRLSGAAAISVALAAAVPLPFGAGRAVADTTPENGLLCDTSPNSNFVLTAQAGYITTPDGNSIYTWGYSNGSKPFQYPGSVLCVSTSTDDTKPTQVSLTLTNKLPVPTSLNVVGMENYLFNGKTATPSATDLQAGNLAPSVAPGGSGTYTFTVTKPGTYLYQSGTSPELQDQMGLVGALIVRPAGHPDQVYADGAIAGDTTSTKFDPTREYLHLLSEIDPDLHACFEAAARGQISTPTKTTAPFASTCTNVPYSYDMTRYKPRYWMIDGRSFPDTIAPNNSQHLPAQPYSALVHITPRQRPNGTPDPPAVVRYLNAGPVAYPFHPHAQHEQVVGQDAAKRIGTAAQDLTNDRFSVVVPPGATLETFFSWVDAVGWDPNSRAIDFASPGSVAVPQLQDRNNGEYWSGTPYLGYRKDPKPGETQFNECGEFYDVAHSHALFQATNFGASMGGMLTMIRVDPIGGCPK